MNLFKWIFLYLQLIFIFIKQAPWNQLKSNMSGAKQLQARVRIEMEKQMNSDDRTIKYNKEYLNSLTKQEQLGYS